MSIKRILEKRNGRIARKGVFNKAKNDAAEREMHIIDTALIVACWKGNLNMAIEAIKNGANINAQDIAGTSALEWAKKSGNKELIKYLKSNGAKDKI